MEHIVLLGDSIFDNAPYVAAGSDVVSQLRARLGPGHAASLLARDGDVLADVAGQLAGLHQVAQRLDPDAELFSGLGLGEEDRGGRGHG